MLCKKSSRLQREKKTLQVMVGIYCKTKHSKTHLCSSCQNLLDYAEKRLYHCPYQEKKPTCAKCPIHCYSKEMRRKIQDVMRIAGPKMVLSHPLLLLLHGIDSWITKTK